MDGDNGRQISLEERRNNIVDLLQKDGRVKVSELSKLFNISEVSVRNDLTDMEKQGYLERVHGGAIITYRQYFNMPLMERAVTNKEEKKKIAEMAASLISDGDTVIISTGTTNMYVVRELQQLRSITVITNSIPIALEAGMNNMQVILLGGIFNAHNQFVYGDDSISQLRKYKADKLILSIDGVCAEEGITTYNNVEAELNRKMILRSNMTIVVADYTKIGRVGFSNVSNLENIDMIITNNDADESTISAIREKGIEVRFSQALRKNRN